MFFLVWVKDNLKEFVKVKFGVKKIFKKIKSFREIKIKKNVPKIAHVYKGMKVLCVYNVT
jgi:hypothetical protein